MMDKYGLKRPPLSPLSPSSIQRGQRRRIPANESSDGYGSRVCKENQHPNLTAQKSTPGESRNGKNSSHSKPCASLSGTTQDFCTPLQRRLRDVDLSAVTHRTPLARLIEMQSSKQTRTGRFQLPASNILPRSVHDPKASAQHLRNHVHQSIRNDASRTISLIHNHSIDSTSKRKAHNGVDSRSQSGKDDDVTVIVPEPGQLEWFQSDSQRGVRNLMESFNSACTTEAGTSATPGAPPMTGNNSSQTEEGGTSARLDENFDGAEGDEAVQDEDCRGHYVHDDLSDTKEAKPDLWDGYMDLGPPTSVCRKCNSIMWNEERNNKSRRNSEPTFSLCCRDLHPFSSSLHPLYGRLTKK
ncbi:uncharacterized protein LOC108197994 isoform X3 [Daucus carota subsp. sativus]|uniref:uncharacterized protein LOC108197994 isoform X3 n=1 Tax=Daucus carota subsp. sativus TaxID=79200 RepID=UPI003083D0EB